MFRYLCKLILIVNCGGSFKRLFSSIPKNHYLNGVFRPVDTEVSLTVNHNSTLFNELNGIFAQIGSNPKHIGTKDAGYHWFDGDGMIHSVFFEKNTIKYRNYWIKTKRLQAEEKWGKKMYLYFGELRGLHGIIEIIKWSICQYFALVPGSKGTANTAFLEWKNRTFALHEGDMPYEITFNVDTANITTNNQWVWPNIKSVTAHPKIDIERNELYLYGYNNYDFLEGRFFHNVLDENMKIIRQVNHSLMNNGMVHDIGETKNHLIIPDMPLKYDFSKIMENKLPLLFDTNGTTRFGVFSKNEPENIDWYSLEENIFIFHFCKGCETKDSFTTFACVMDYLDMMDFINLDNEESKIRGNLRLQKLVLNKKTKKVTIEKNPYIEHLREHYGLNCDYNLDFPIENRDFPYVYSSIFNASNGKIIGMIRINTDNFVKNKPNVYLFTDRYMNSEPQIISINNKDYILSFTYDSTDQSYISLLDMENDIIHDVNMPSFLRIPPGFHSHYFNRKRK